MTRAFSIPLVRADSLRHSPPRPHDIQPPAPLASLFKDLALRDPPVEDACRWHEHALDGTLHRFARPLTFTPYAAARACSARCRFCSETLRNGTTGPMAAGLRPGAGYFDALRAALAALKGVPLSYSLSGLEATDDPDWLLALLDTLRAPAAGPDVEGAVLYTNGAGLVEHRGALLPALAALPLSWIEWSRHHDQAPANQRIMRFRPGHQVMHQPVFEDAVAAVNARLPVQLVCVVQQGGIETPDDVMRYVRWARALGVGKVIFREFSELPAHYMHNTTRRYIDSARIAMDALLQGCIEDRRFRDRHTPQALTRGYYFWNARWRDAQGVEVVFERSDYRALHAREASGLVYKLVFHANGHLCSGWQPDQNILWRPR